MLYTLGECGSETISRKSVKGGLGHQRRGPHDSPPVNVNELDPESIGHVPTNLPHSSSPVQFCIFADGAAAIHMVIKGRSLHVRNATGPRSVYFHCLLERNDLGSRHLHQVCADDGSDGRDVDTGCTHVSAIDISVKVMGHVRTRLQPLSKSLQCCSCQVLKQAPAQVLFGETQPNVHACWCPQDKISMETIVKINALRGTITNVYADGNIFLENENFFRVQTREKLTKTPCRMNVDLSAMK